jgi:hypothetical protein
MNTMKKIQITNITGFSLLLGCSANSVLAKGRLTCYVKFGDGSKVEFFSDGHTIESRDGIRRHGRRYDAPLPLPNELSSFKNTFSSASLPKTTTQNYQSEKSKENSSYQSPQQKR